MRSEIKIIDRKLNFKKIELKGLIDRTYGLEMKDMATGQLMKQIETNIVTKEKTEIIAIDIHIQMYRIKFKSIYTTTPLVDGMKEETLDLIIFNPETVLTSIGIRLNKNDFGSIFKQNFLRAIAALRDSDPKNVIILDASTDFVGR